VLKTDLALPAAAAAVVVTAVARVHWPAGLFVKLLPAWKSADGVAESAWQQVTAVAAAVVVTESRVAMVAAVLSNVVAARFALLAAVVLVATFLTVQLPRLLHVDWHHLLCCCAALKMRQQQSQSWCWGRFQVVLLLLWHQSAAAELTRASLLMTQLPRLLL
jgi:hypothetical protein